MAHDTKRCTRCGETKPIDQFPLCRGRPRARCKPCHTADARGWALANHEAYLGRMRQWHRNNKKPRFMGPPLPEHIKKERAQAKQKRWREENPEKHKAAQKAWAEKNKHKAMEVVRRRQAAKLQATVAWADVEAMQMIYAIARRVSAETGVPHDVDHVVPLKGATVCGLHWEGNMQLLPRKENRQKHNRYWPDMP